MATASPVWELEFDISHSYVRRAESSVAPDSVNKSNGYYVEQWIRSSACPPLDHAIQKSDGAGI